MAVIYNHKNLPIVFKYRWMWHILFWLVMYAVYAFSYGGYYNANYYYEAIINAEQMPVRILFTYLMVYLLVPKFLLKRKFKTFFSLTFLHAFLFGLAVWMVCYYIVSFREYTGSRNYPLFHFPKILVSIISNYGITLIAVIIKLFKWWYLDQMEKNQLEKDKLASEIRYLKSQIHPHFLFNTLNNLYSLTLSQSKKASDVVIKLADILDYMIYHSGKERISLEKELQILNNYIDLEKIRYGDRLTLSFDVEGNVTGKNIAPLMLFPLVENAFKHGASEDSRNPMVNVSLKIYNDLLHLKVVNSLPKLVTEGKKNNNGIGLDNMHKQLDILYPNNHKLILEKNDTLFTANLKLPLLH